MKKKYIKPYLEIITYSIEVPISASGSEEPEYPSGEIDGGGGTSEGGISEGDANRRMSVSPRDEMVGSWRRGGLW